MHWGVDLCISLQYIALKDLLHCTAERHLLQPIWVAGKPARICSALFLKHCTALHYTALHCTTLQCSALHCIALHCTALHWSRAEWAKAERLWLLVGIRSRHLLQGGINVTSYRTTFPPIFAFYFWRMKNNSKQFKTVASKVSFTQCVDTFVLKLGPTAS